MYRDDIIIIRYYYDVGDKSLKSEFYVERICSDENIRPELYEYGENNEDINRILNERDLTQEDVFKIYEWILYDKILTDWFNANEGNTRFSIDNLGNVVFIE